MPRLNVKKLAVYAADELEAGVKAPVLAKRLAAYALQERMSRELLRVLRAVEIELSKRGHTQVTVTSAHEVSVSVKNELAKLLQADKPVFSEVIDSGIIGGVKARAGESEIDLTVRGRLNRFKQQVISSK